jgi:HD-GYP domain-containing protein (c-di-GMP phosphodiesterase class II)
LALLYQNYGLTGLLLLLGPIALLHYSQRQYVTHTAAHVTELSTLNQELTASNQRLTDANERLERTLGDLRLANESMLTALCEALELRDQETEGHSQRVVSYARATAAALGLDPEGVQAVVHGAHLHDIGKIGVADSILLKPGPLTADEWAEMKRHPEIGYRMIAHIPFLMPAAVLVRHHHERWDGRGYPDGLAATAIPIGARIFNVVDAFDAMTSDRPYKSAMPIEAALVELARNRGTQFDPDVVDTFVRLVTSGGIEVQRNRPAEEMDATVDARDQVRQRTLALKMVASTP